MFTFYMHAAKKQKRKKRKRKKYKISFISIIMKGLSRGFHLINVKRQPNNSLLCSKIRKGKGGNEHVSQFSEKGQFVFKTEIYRFFFFLSRAWKITRKIIEVIPKVASRIIGCFCFCFLNSSLRPANVLKKKAFYSQVP